MQRLNGYVGVQFHEGVAGGVGLAFADIPLAVENLTVEVGLTHLAAVTDPQAAGPGRCEVHGRRAAQAASASDENGCRAQLFLPGLTPSGKKHLPLIALQFFPAEGHGGFRFRATDCLLCRRGHSREPS